MAQGHRYVKEIQTLYPEEEINKILSIYLARHGFTPFHYKEDIYFPKFSWKLAPPSGYQGRKYCDERVWKSRITFSPFLNPYFFKFQHKGNYVRVEAWELKAYGTYILGQYYADEYVPKSWLFKRMIRKIEDMINPSIYSG